MSFFSIESPLYKFMTSLLNVLKLNFCWLIACIPIITIGPATIAAFDVALKMVDDEEGYVGRQFLKAFKSNFKQGIPLGIITALCIYVIYLDFEIFNAVESNPIVFLIIGILSIYLFTLSLIYAYPLVARYDNSIINSLRNSYKISMKYIGRTVFMLVIVSVEIFAFFWNWTLIFFWILIGPACIIYTISGFSKYIFRQIENDME